MGQPVEDVLEGQGKVKGYDHLGVFVNVVPISAKTVMDLFDVDFGPIGLIEVTLDGQDFIEGQPIAIPNGGAGSHILPALFLENRGIHEFGGEARDDPLDFVGVQFRVKESGD